MNFRCECGHRIHDNTDNLPYKGYFIADQDQDDLMDEIDAAIEESGPSPQDKEEAAMRIRSLTTRLFKSAYQCSKCGNLFMDLGPAGLEMFRGVDPVNKNLLQSALGEQWRGHLYGEWKDTIPEWQTSHGTLYNETNVSDPAVESSGGGQYGDWGALERDYYELFHELKDRDVIRYSQLKKNGTVLHSWSLPK
ncbi:hypothetical protein [Paenibacillus piscarius]|uniref:hypothetical protein n=1 Tax=Paenibacillus piscarius TaxID=1089681 RepID=UPI001EE787CF|nr:hypothetical protein [Paenibacillus piscarius]